MSQEGHGYSICDREIHDALNEKYKLRKYGEDEWNIATLVLRIGGPKLLHVLHATHWLPAVKSVQARSSKTNVCT